MNKDFIDHTPIEMLSVLEELKVKIQDKNFLHPEQYLDKDIKLIYSIAHKYYTIGEYHQSEELFINLVIARPTEKIFWHSLASSRQMLANYSEALVCWGICALLDSENPNYHIYGAECLCSINEIDSAYEALSHAKTLLNNDLESSKKFEKIKLMIERKSHGN